MVIGKDGAEDDHSHICDQCEAIFKKPYYQDPSTSLNQHATSHKQLEDALRVSKFQISYETEPFTHLFTCVIFET